MSTSEKPYHHGDLREALVKAAIAIVEAGEPAPSLREVARRAGVSHTAPYRHFADKEALLAAVGEDAYEGLTASMREHAGRYDTPFLRYRGSGRGYVAYALAHPAQFRLMFGPDLPKVSDHPGLHTAADEAFDVLVGLIVAAQDAGEMTPAPAHELALTSWALVHGLATLILDQRIGDAGMGPHAIDLADQLVDRLGDGLRARP